MASAGAEGNIGIGVSITDVPQLEQNFTFIANATAHDVHVLFDSTVSGSAVWTGAGVGSAGNTVVINGAADTRSGDREP
jgi:hypothetical protein